jgi:uncharacterized protein
MMIQGSTSAATDVDPRSFHVFELEGSRLLFDRATGATMQLNDVAFESLRMIEQYGVESGLPRLLEQRPELEMDDLRQALGEMKSQGMFRFEPLDRAAQDAYLERLWMHQPRRIQMLMAQGCNLGCRYCYAWRNGSNQKHTLMPWEIARQAVDYLVWRSGPRPELQITFFGGEPLLNYPVLRQVVEYGRSIEKLGHKKFIFELCTNCTLMGKEVVDFLVEQKFLLFMSIDGWREMHNYNRPAVEKDDLYDTIVANARYANEQYRLHKLFPPKVRANLTNKYNDLRAVAKYLEELGFINVDVGAIEPLPHGDPSPAALTEDQADELHVKYEAIIVEALEKVKSGGQLGVHSQKAFNRAVAPAERLPAVGVICGIGRNTLVVDNKGNLFPCHRYEGMNAFILGDIFTGLDREATMRYYRQVNGHATEHCDDCWIRDYCGGGCAWLLSARDGHLADPTERECNRRRHGMEIGLWARSELRKRFPHRFNGGIEMTLDRWSWDSTPECAPSRKVSLRVLPQMRPNAACGC